MRIATAALLFPILLAAGCGSQGGPATNPQATPGETGKQTAGLPTVLDSGFGQRDEYAWITAVVKNDKGAEGRFVTVQFNIHDAAGKLIASESQTESFSRAGETLAIGTQVRIPGGAKVGKVEPTVVLGNETHEEPFPEIKTTSAVIAAHEYSSDQFTATFNVVNPLAEPLENLRVGVVCFDAAGKVIGGTSEYPDVVPGSGEAVVEADLMTSGKPEKCDVYVGAPV